MQVCTLFTATTSLQFNYPESLVPALILCLLYSEITEVNSLMWIYLWHMECSSHHSYAWY